MNNQRSPYIFAEPFAAVHATLGGASGSAEDVAGMLWVGGHSNMHGSGLAPQYAHPEGTADGSWKAPPRDWLAARIEETAGFLHANALSMVKNGEAAGYSRVNGEGNDFTDRHGASGHWHATTPEVSAQRVEDAASFLISTRWSFSEKGPEHGYGGPGASKGGTWGQEARDEAIGIERFDRLLTTGPMPAARQVANIIRSWKDEEPRALWERLKAKGWPSLLLPEGCRGRWLGPQSLEDVAGYLAYDVRTHPGGGGFLKTSDYETNKAHRPNNKRVGGVNYHPESPAPQVEILPPFPPLAVWQGFAEDLTLPVDLSGVVIFADPPYQGTTGYKHGTCPRETVLRLAREWSARGAIVAISEAVRLDRDLGEGWFAVDISHARKGQARTFSKQQSEWLTLNRPPQYVPPKQQGLFQ